MKLKVLIQNPILMFVVGVVVGILGLMSMDAVQASTPRANPSPRTNIAQRSTSSPAQTPSPEASLTPSPTETSGLSADVTPPLDATPTQELALAQTITVTLVTPNRTASPRPAATLRSIATPRISASPTPTVDPRRGDSPFSALNLTDNWQTINANSILWYKLGEETSYPLGGEIWLDAYGKSGIGFSVFSPEQANDLNVATTPKGRGALTKFTDHDLYWTGGSPRAGIWYVLVTSSNPVPVQFKLNSSITAKDRKNCRSYWEYIGPNLVYWTACQ